MPTLLDITGDPQRWEECLHLNYEEWGPPLSLEAYLERERGLDFCITAAGLAHRMYALVDEHSILAACEVLSRPLYYGGGRLAQDHVIASVFVPQSHRRQGYAAQLISQVTELIIEGDDQASLWSDVGDFYARCGYRFPAPKTEDSSVPQPWQSSLLCYPLGNTQNTCDWLTQEHMGQVIEDHRRLLCKAADVLYHGIEGEVDYAVVVPHQGLYGQLQFRGIFSAKMLQLPTPTHFGARTRNGHGWIAWAHMFTSKTLLVLGIYGTADEVAELLKAACAAAEQYDGFKVEMYESTLIGAEVNFGEVHAALEGKGLNAELRRRKTSLPMSVGQAVWAYPGGYAWY